MPTMTHGDDWRSLGYSGRYRNTKKQLDADTSGQEPPPIAMSASAPAALDLTYSGSTYVESPGTTEAEDDSGDKHECRDTPVGIEASTSPSVFKGWLTGQFDADDDGGYKAEYEDTLVSSEVLSDQTSSTVIRLTGESSAEDKRGHKAEVECQDTFISSEDLTEETRSITIERWLTDVANARDDCRDEAGCQDMPVQNDGIPENEETSISVEDHTEEKRSITIERWLTDVYRDETECEDKPLVGKSAPETQGWGLLVRNDWLAEHAVSQQEWGVLVRNDLLEGTNPRWFSSGENLYGGTICFLRNCQRCGTPRTNISGTFKSPDDSHGQTRLFD